jgi:hypothetical protein
MRPLQFWLPTLEGSPAGSPFAWDLRQAFARWDEDDVVWLIPWIDQVVRWVEPTIPRQEVAIPAKHFNRIAVYHVSRNGYLSGLGALQYFPSGRLDDALLDTWLSVGERGALLAGEPPEEIILAELPEIHDGQFIRYTRPARVHPQWTGANRPAFFLPKPLTPLLPFGGRWEQWAELEGMATVAKTSAQSLAQALRVATAYAGAYMSEGVTTVARASLMPIKVHEGEGGVIDVTHRFVPSVRSLAQAVESAEWCDLAMQPITIRRVWGVFGLFWTLLVERLEGMRPFCVCDDCKRLLPGPHRRRHCGPQDDAECFHARRSRDTQRCRAHQQSRGAAQSRVVKPPDGR